MNRPSLNILIAGVFAPVCYLAGAFIVMGALGLVPPWHTIGLSAPQALWLLLALPLAALVSLGLVRFRRPRWVLPDGSAVMRLPPSWRQRLHPWLSGVGISAMGAMVVGLAGPRTEATESTSDREGIDIVFALDVSLSMQARDIQPDRFAGMIAVVDAFVRSRPRDRLGCVVFGREAYTLIPLTTDHSALRATLRSLELGAVDGRGTAIGNAVGLALNRLRASEAATRVVILLTDGESNSGNLSPAQSAELAAELGITLYTVLIGQSASGGPPSGDLFDRMLRSGEPEFPVNPELLEEMARRTGGEAFVASDRAGLEQSFHAILDALERSEIHDDRVAYRSLAGLPMLVALCFMLVGIVVSERLLGGTP